MGRWRSDHGLSRLGRPSDSGRFFAENPRYLCGAARAGPSDRGVVPDEDRPRAAGTGPDLLFIARENLGRLKGVYLDGPADLAIEVVSPGSHLRDRGEKLAEYEMGGVREYWIIDPDERRADFHVLAADGRYERRRAGEDGIYPSEVITGFRLREAWLWQQPRPKALSALKELGVA